MLQEQELPTWFQHASHFVQPGPRIGHRAHHHRAGDAIEAGVVERQAFGWRLHQFDRRSAVHAQLAPQHPQHVRVRLGQDQISHHPGEERQVRAGAGTKIEHSPMGLTEHLAPRLAQAALVDRRIR